MGLGITFRFAKLKFEIPLLSAVLFLFVLAGAASYPSRTRLVKTENVILCLALCLAVLAGYHAVHMALNLRHGVRMRRIRIGASIGRVRRIESTVTPGSEMLSGAVGLLWLALSSGVAITAAAKTGTDASLSPAIDAAAVAIVSVAL